MARRYLSEEDAETLLVICGQVRRCAAMPPANRLLFNALASLEELREKVTRPGNMKLSEDLGEEIVTEDHPY